MKIEVGKFYRCRDGSKARIYAVDAGGWYPVHGAMYNGNFWRTNSWTGDGHHNKPSANSEFDLVAEWVDPPEKKKLYAWMISNDQGWLLQFTSEKYGFSGGYSKAHRIPALDQEVGEC